MKIICDDAAADARRRQSNNASHDNAWETLRFRIANEAQTVSHLAALNVVTTAQTGDTENEATVSPVRTATGDAIVGGVGVSAEQVAANVANLATTLTPIITSAIATAINQTLEAVLPALVTAVGGASTPSQTKAPTA
jgi:tryptophan synthase alpha subunit